MKNYIKALSGMLVAIAVYGGLTASAAEVRVGLSTRETYVGQPVTLRVQIADATKAEAPKVPDVDGLTIKPLGSPSRSTQVTIINGQTTTSTTQTFAYELTPQRAGSFQIPPFAVDVDGKSQRTQALEFIASKSETGDLMFVEIAGKQKEIYVGQGLDVTLKMWIRPYSDRRLKVKLSEGDMWRLVSEKSEWGPFSERLQQLAEHDQRPVGKEVLRKDANGVEHSYYLYQIETTIYPKKPGTIGAENVTVVVNYPTALGRSRGMFADFFGDTPGGNPGAFDDDDGFSPFGAQLTIQTVRPLVTQAVVEPIKVLPIPTVGRPADYRGAVGQYQIAIDATPTHVKSGDPINLLIGVTGTGPMELVQAPPLAELPELATDFKVPNEPLAGFVKGEQKVFSTTIRPRKPGVAQIPSIPFSFFDPSTGKFGTVHSKPVSIQVEQAEMLALDAVEHNGQAGGTNSTSGNSPAATTAMSSLDNFSGDELLATQAPWKLNHSLSFLLLAVPPLVVLLMAMARLRSNIAIASGWFGSAASRLQKTILYANDSAEIASAIKSFVAKQCKLGRFEIDAEKVVGAIRVAGRRNLAIRCEQLLNRCVNEISGAPFSDEATLDGLKQQAAQWSQDWQSESERQSRKPNGIRPKSAAASVKASSAGRSTSTIVGGIVMVGLLFFTGQSASAKAVELSTGQQQSLLAEANESYKAALAKVNGDSAEAKQGFTDAAEKYQLLVDVGISNSRLYFNLANSYLESGQAGKAIANYRRCLRIDPTMKQAHENLAHAQKLANGGTESKDGAQQSRSFAWYASAVNDWLVSRISPRTMFGVMIVAWGAIWAAIGLRVLGLRLPWRTAVSVGTVLFLIAATSTMLTSQTASRREAVIVGASTAGPPESAEAAKFTQGQVVELLQQRGDSVRVRAENGETIWLPSDLVEAI